ncbi:MAG: hypothetical protein ABIV50_14825 [Opitutus sp.]
MISAVHQMRRAALLAGVLSLAVGLRGQTPIKESPFLPAANAASPSKSANAAYELAGMSVAGKATLLSILRTSDKRSIWVAVGQTVGEVTAVSYDPKTDEATIRAKGKLLTLGMKKSAVVNGPAARVPTGPMPVITLPANVKPPQAQPVAVAAPPVSVQEEKETEARMLVTDLLEIGQEQRRAYEEAQKQAASKSGKPGTPPKR